MKIDINSWLNGSVIFSHDCENNSIKLTLEKGVKSGISFDYANLANADLTDAYLANAYLANANLTNANLTDAYLANANLTNANLANADLTDAYLANANLTNANLANANLTDAYLANANLTNANLTNANLTNAIGNKKEIKSMHVTKYSIVWTSKMLFIGCESHTKEQWLAFSDDDIESMDKGALDWWKEWKSKLIVLGVFS